MSVYDKDWVREQVFPLARGSVVQAPLTEMSTAEAAKAYAILDQLFKKLEHRKEALRARLLQEAEACGTQNEKGGYKLRCEDTIVMKERREGKVPEREPLQELLRNEGIGIDEVFDAVTVYEINPSKLSHLVAVGKLDQAQLDELKRVTWALRVTPGADLADLLEEALTPPPAPAPQPKVLVESVAAPAPAPKKRTTKAKAAK